MLLFRLDHMCGENFEKVKGRIIENLLVKGLQIIRSAKRKHALYNS